MDMILLDWTRMGKSYCLAGAVLDKTGVRIVRPLWNKHRTAAVRNVGWSAFLIDGHQRWERFELVGADQAPCEPPHVEDVWVRGMRPLRCSATTAQRRLILEATQPPAGESLFGAALQTFHACALIPAGSGQRSLTTICLPSSQLQFSGAWRGVGETDIRVRLPVPDLGQRYLAVKDHHLLKKATQFGGDVKRQLNFLNDQVRAMGDAVAVRLGLSRPFPYDGTSEPACWLMADGFFSLTDPQP